VKRNLSEEAMKRRGKCPKFSCDSLFQKLVRNEERREEKREAINSV